MEKIKLTYFTPTYNRENLLPNLYNSLLNQTNKNFIWLVIDDGSTDNTENLINNWKNENLIKIEYYKKQNGGKQSAIEYSNMVCSTEYISCIDSDDYLTNDATDILYSKFEFCKNEDICGIVGRRAHLDKTPFSENWTKTNNEILYFYNDLQKKYNYYADTILIFKTNIIKQFHFPIFENEKFVTESVLYKQFMYKYRILAMNECLYISEYQNDGYTKQGIKLAIKNPNGFAYSYKQNAYFDIKNDRNFLKKIKSTAIFYGWIGAMHIKTSFTQNYKLPFFYRFFGTITKPILTLIMKKYLSKKM